ncbi:MAG: hypothetical protein N3G21_12765, partial [Candidatus Hydrogenedentes bacterium]|nr:hypothetical protein [Candidatus Hydrogenedentota bacterium]
PPIHSAPPQWVEISLPCDLLPSNESFIITWSSYNLPDWIIKNGLQPTISVNSYSELKSLIFDDKIYTCPPKKFLLLGGPYEIIRCVEQKNN